MTLHRRCDVAWHGWRRLTATAALVIGTTCGAAAVAIPASAVQGQSGGVRIGRHPKVSTQSGAENAAFNAELFDGSSHSPLVMNGGDTIQVHTVLNPVP